jgi:hypothetical protein
LVLAELKGVVYFPVLFWGVSPLPALLIGDETDFADKLVTLGACAG